MGPTPQRPPLRDAPPVAAFRVRPARRGDGDGLSALLRELGYPNAADTQTVHWVVSHPEIEVFVAVDGGDKPVGMLSFSHHPQLRLKGRIGTIDELVVSVAWRGKGVGRALLQKAVDRARTLTVKRLELHAPEELGEPARGFFEKCGFRPTGTTVFRYSELEVPRTPR
ncbi:MAG: GNAT family N-acetyltransferase [Myxococcaceae bacterium]|nr:GNAT family N-acetyltransferase [Myxococcaceae bacterium]MCI0671479.1 GNAT family N-acetyltransferase [Myxococcaceae bacterium]